MQDGIPRSADAVIIGGGCMGASIAYHLTRAGLRNIVLLEKGALASGPTGRSSAQTIPRSENAEISKLKWEGVDFFRNFEAHTGRSADFITTGYIGIASQNHEEAIHADLKTLAICGSKAAFLNAAQLRQKYSVLHVAEDEVGLEIPEVGYADPTAAVHAWTDYAAEHGARICPFTTARAIHTEGGRIASVSIDQGSISTPRVVLTAGIWSNVLLQPLGMPLPLFLHKVEVGCYRHPASFENHPVVADFVQNFYFRPEHDRFTLAGNIPKMQPSATRPHELALVNSPDDYGETFTGDSVRELLKKLVHRSRGFEHAYWRRGYSCIYDVTPDWHPILDFEQRLPGMFTAAGFSGHGFVLSPAIGRLATETIVHGIGVTEVSRLLGADRFELGRPVSFSIG
jgi:sarcosine oxidase, subunit beta